MSDTSNAAPEPAVPAAALATRSLVGGLFMGLANLVPGISGGTMLLAAGVYPRFIKAIAEVTTLRFRGPSLVVLGSVAVAAGVAIGLLAGVVKDLVVHHRWIMYSLFVGLTLGGLPVVWRMARPATRGLWVGAVVGLLAMALLSLAQAFGAGTGAVGSSSMAMLFFAGLAGASAMILPGVSGGYLLLLLGQYVPILGGIETFVHALKARDLTAATDPAIHILVPVGIGVVLGVVAVSNLLKLLLQRYEKPTLGVLLGLLVGAVVGLWPFQRGVPPALGSTFKGSVVTAELLAKIPPHKYPTEFFSPSATEVVAGLGLVAAGFLITVGVARLGREVEQVGRAARSPAC